ncbi:hypothetical protein AQUCO_01700699v1, partial [Aquilegia coerulea]
MILPSTYGISGNETDQHALLTFKDHVSQNSVRALSSWNVSLHFCEWEGVACDDRREKVISLNLESQRLVGSLSPYIGNLSFLKMLNLQNNSLTGVIPQEIGYLFRLQELLMSNNSLSGRIPVSLSNCSDLINLSAAYNNLIGNIPVEFGSFSKLVTLDLHVNKFTGVIPASFGNLSSLRSLNLQQNSLDGSIPSALGHLQRLVLLLLGANSLSGELPLPLFNLSSLTKMSFTQNQLQGSLPYNIGLNLPNLRIILLAINKLSGSIPLSLFKNTSSLQRVDLGGNSFVGKVPTEVGRLGGLEYLHVGGNNIGSRGEEDDLEFITFLNNCSHLQFLDVDGNQFGGMLPSSVTNLSTELKELYLGGNQISGSIPSEIGKLFNLIIFAVDGNFLTGVIPTSIGMLQKLQILVFRDNKLSGKLPYSMGNISQLYGVDLSNNMLEGNILTSFERCQYLKILTLSHNHLGGSIPTQILGLSLVKIDLSYNSLTGPIPLEVGNLKTIQKLDVSHNKISGGIPNTLGSCLSLEFLYLQGNFLQGHIPSSLSFLKGIQSLDLSQNNLSGKIPTELVALSYLKVLNISFNHIEGEVPVKGVFQNVSAFYFAGNDELCGGIPKLKLHKCDIVKSKKTGMSSALKVTLGVLFPSLFAAVCLAWYLLQKSANKPSTTDLLDVPSELQRVSYNELHKATNGFSATNIIGKGSYGTVYIGVLHQDEHRIAVKVLSLVEQGASKSFLAECEVLRQVRHRNLIKIFTVCSSMDFEGNDFKALVFDYMSNGSVEDWLHSSSKANHQSGNLNFLERLNITIDVASALDYLHNHCQTPIVHCDLKSSNVLLDHDMVAYVGDFGLAKILPKAMNNVDGSRTNSIAVRGTIGYIPPEYGMGSEVSTQGDIYSYGILVLEMFTGKRPTDEMFKDGLTLHDFSEVALTRN